MTFSRIAIIRGGQSHEHDVSLASGNNILKILSPHYTLVDIVLDREGSWHVQGIPRTPVEALKHVDVAINALHGAYGEDGKIQQILERANIPYTGSGILAGALGMNKWQAKEIFKKNGLKTPRATRVEADEDLSEKVRDIFHSFTFPVIIKPVSSGSSIGVSIARDLASLESAFVSVFEYCDSAIVEEYIKGKEATCLVIENFREQKYYAFPPIEIVKHSDVSFDQSMKYSGEVEERCPGIFSEIEKNAIMQSAINAHTSIGARHYSRSDFIVHPTRGVYILEINTLPGLTENSLAPKALEAVGSNMKEFLEHIIAEVLA